MSNLSALNSITGLELIIKLAGLNALKEKQLKNETRLEELKTLQIVSAHELADNLALQNTLIEGIFMLESKVSNLELEKIEAEEKAMKQINEDNFEDFIEQLQKSFFSQQTQ